MFNILERWAQLGEKGKTEYLIKSCFMCECMCAYTQVTKLYMQADQLSMDDEVKGIFFYFIQFDYLCFLNAIQCLCILLGEIAITSHCLLCKSLQSCSTHCDPVDCSPPGSSVLGILQARILEWVAMPCSRVSLQPRHQAHISYVSSTSKHAC